MVICFNCSPETKRILDRLLAEGEYRDYGEVISVSVANLEVLQQRLAHEGALVIEPPTYQPHDRPSVKLTEERYQALARQNPKRGSIQVPDLFALQEVDEPPCEARVPTGPILKHEHVPVEKWIFGQYNRLLPLKVSCRGLANLLLAHPTGVELEVVGPLIAKGAAELAEWLAKHESRFGIHRDEALSTAFPSGGQRAEKSLIRFQTQFVAASTRSGDLSGLPADLKLVGHVGDSTRRIALTDAGWRYALERNPLLENEQQSPAQKFSLNEQELLLTHIASEVEVEDFAYRAILQALEDGATSPGDLDEALAGEAEGKNKVTGAFLSTQRSGAVSRMSDLGLIMRIRNGVKVSYVATPRGLSYSSSAVKAL